MKTKVERLAKSRDYVVVFKRHLWSPWKVLIHQRFVSKANAEAYAKRFEWKVKHPRKYKRMLQKYPKEYFVGTK